MQTSSVKPVPILPPGLFLPEGKTSEFRILNLSRRFDKAFLIDAQNVGIVIEDVLQSNGNGHTDLSKLSRGNKEPGQLAMPCPLVRLGWTQTRRRQE
jgi:hypothetical protein